MALARILRGRVFVEECQVPGEQEFDAHDEACRHVLGLGEWGSEWLGGCLGYFVL
jgi:hypothetical protein